MSVHAERIPRPKIRTRSREVTTSHATLLDKVGYCLGLGASYLVLMSLWYYAAESKIIAGGFSAPAGVIRQFKGSFIASVPGTGAAWVILAVCEALVFIGLVVSLARGEFLPHRAKDWLLGSSIGSLLVLAMLAFGESMTGQHANVPSFFAYIGATILVIGMVRLMPPYRSERWLSSTLTDERVSEKTA
jgi:hypothetical protein